MNHDPNFCMYTQLIDTINDAKIQLKTGLSLPYIIAQLHCTFMFDAEFDTYVSSRIQIGSEHILVAYHTVVPNDWNEHIAGEDISAINPTKRRRIMLFYFSTKTFLWILMNKYMLFGKVLRKFGNN